MGKSKVVSIRVPPVLLKAIDDKLAARPRRFGRSPGRSELILDAVAAYTEFDDTINSVNNVNKEVPGEDIDAVRDRVLSSLKVGKQSGEYRRTKDALDKLAAELIQAPPLPPLEALPRVS